MAKKDPGVSVTAVINPLDRLKLEVLVRDEILTRGQNSSVSSMVANLLHSLLELPLMQKKILACAERQAAQDTQLGRTNSPAQALAAYRGVQASPPQPPQPPTPTSTQPVQPQPEPAELTEPEQPVFDLASLNPGLRVASKVRPAGYPGSEASPAPATTTPVESEPEPEFGDARRARGLIG